MQQSPIFETLGLRNGLIWAQVKQPESSNLVMDRDALQLMLFGSLALILDVFIVQRGTRWLQRKVILPERGHSGGSGRNFNLGFTLLRLVLRLIIWLSLVSWILRATYVASPLERDGISLGEFLARRLELIFVTPFITLGQTRISLSFVFILIILSIFVFIVARWLSEWIRSQILSQVGIDRGAQEAITRVIGYSLTLVGLIIVLQTAGIDLSSLTVLAGVLGIGFGFGLQTLAGNFISGLAILIEHPIKVGDFVEVDGLLGTVEKISIRATVIRTNDHQYVIVPNNRFIEKNVVNWSYASANSRIHIPINVAYGSDPVLVTEALLNCARQDPRVLISPAPTVWLRSFGDHGYDFDLLVWIDCPQDSEPIKSALNFRIQQEFQLCGIEVPFPQLELHVKDGRTVEVLPQTVLPQAPLHPPDSPAERKPSRRPLPNSMRPLKDLLRSVSYFSSCSEVELRTLIELGYRQFFPYNRVICREQEEGDTFYIILSGSVEVRSEQLDQVLAVLERGDFFGEMSLLTGMPRTATVRCLEDTTLFVVDRQVLQKLLKAYPNLADEIAKELSERQQVLMDLGLMDANGKLESSIPPLLWIRQRLRTLLNLET